MVTSVSPGGQREPVPARIYSSSGRRVRMCLYTSVSDSNVTIIQQKNMNIMVKTFFTWSKFFLVCFAQTKNCSLFLLFSFLFTSEILRRVF